MGYAIRGVDRRACPDRARERVSFIRRNAGSIEPKHRIEGVPKMTLQQNIELIRAGRQWKVPAGRGIERSRRS